MFLKYRDFFLCFLILIFFLSFQFGGYSDSNIQAVILPHDNYVSKERRNYLAKISKNLSPRTIVIVSVNHFSAGKAQILTAKKVWRLLEGEIYPDEAKIDSLVAKGVIKTAEAPFVFEHGIFNLLSDLYQYFPKAKILPLIIKPTTPEEKVEALADDLRSICQESCLLVASVDFSHYLPAKISIVHDQFSQKALNNLDKDLIWQAETDSPETLFLTLLWAKGMGAEKFRVYKNTRSGLTSHIFATYEKGKANSLVKKKTFSFVPKEELESFKRLENRVVYGTDLLISDCEDKLIKLLGKKGGLDLCDEKAIISGEIFGGFVNASLVPVIFDDKGAHFKESYY